MFDKAQLEVFKRDLRSEKIDRNISIENLAHPIHYDVSQKKVVSDSDTSVVTNSQIINNNTA